MMTRRQRPMMIALGLLIALVLVFWISGSNPLYSLMLKFHGQ